MRKLYPSTLLKRSMGALLLLFSATISHGQVTPGCTNVLYSNGQFDSLVVGGGAGGADISVIRTGSTSYGFKADTATRVADNFVVTGSGWAPNKLTFYSYMTNSPTSPSPITSVAYLALWTTTPAAGGTPAYVSTTNPIANNAWTNVYRVTSTAVTSTARAIMAIGIPWPSNFPTTLAAGTYWLELGLLGNTTYTGPWIPAAVPTNGNAKQHTATGDAWVTIADGTNAAELPFAICGSIVTRVSSVELEKSVTTTPTAVNKNVQVRVKGYTGNMTLRIIDVAGREVLKQRFTNFYDADMGSYMKGMYFLEITSERTGEQIVRKVVKY